MTAQSKDGEFAVMEFAIKAETEQKLEHAKSESFPRGGPVVGQSYAFLCTQILSEADGLVARFQLVPMGG